MAASEFRTAFDQARRLHAEGKYREAEAAYRRLAEAGGDGRPLVLESLADLYLEQRRPREGMEVLSTLTREFPGNFYYHSRLAWTLDAVGRSDTAAEYFERLIENRPGVASLHFNLALLYRKLKRYDEAVTAYQEALSLGIDRPQEVWSNLGVLASDRRRPGEARSNYEKALELDPGYVPALFNLAGLHEEAGEREEAVRLYERILAIEPSHRESLARIAHAQRATGTDDPVIARLRTALEEAGDDPGDEKEGREALLFALGKLLDDLEEYGEAFEAYRQANRLNRGHRVPYDRDASERAASALIETFGDEWLRRVETAREESPVFICGMFRSGSSLLEQILAGHPAVTGGGELDLVSWLIERRFAPYPLQLAQASREDVDAAAGEYLRQVQALFPGAGIVTDKRPDNFLYLGLVRAMFPRARIVYTQRDPRDVCLSIYCQRLGGNLNYASDAGDTAHFYLQHRRLMEHWQSLFADNIHTVDYDRLVVDPEAVLADLLGFLDLEWDPAMLDFAAAEHHVKTASVWQVRESLHEASSGRWRNYESEPEIREMTELLAALPESADSR